MKRLIRKCINKLGYDIARYPSLESMNRLTIFKNLNINLIIDVGANNGQYVLEMKKLGYKGRTISFEPTSAAYESLVQNSKRFDDWSVLNMAVGNFNGEIEINIANNSVSSSVLNMLPLHLDAAPESRFVKKEKVKIVFLDSMLTELIKSGNGILLKIDTQGFEKPVLEGSSELLKLVKAVHMEMSLSGLYENETLFVPMIQYMEGKGFKLVSIERGFVDEHSGHLLQVDATFVKDELG